MSESKVRHFQEWWRHKFGFVPHGDRVVCTLCHKSIVTRTSSVRRHFNTKHGPLIPPNYRLEYIRKCVKAFENMQPRPDLESFNVPMSKKAESLYLTNKQTPSNQRNSEMGGKWTSGVDDKRSPSPDSKICLKWNTYHTNIQNIFPSLLINEQFVDVTLACEGRFMKCHKVILSACSPYLEELLSQNPCQHPIIFMRDIKFWEIRSLVEFMYSGEVNVAEEKLPSLLRAAEALQVKGLTNVNQTTNHDSADSEDIPLSEKLQDFPTPKPGRRKRILSDSTGKSNEPLPNDLPSLKKVFKKEKFPVQSTSSNVCTQEVEDVFSNSQGLHETLVANLCQNLITVNNPVSVKEEPPSSSKGGPSTSLNDSAAQERLSDESSQESDSEQEQYTFSMYANQYDSNDSLTKQVMPSSKIKKS